MKRTHNIYTCILALLFCLVAFASAADLRHNQNFNRGWKFHLGDVPGAEATKFDDANWEHTNLPHSFSMPYFGTEKFYVGYGWYRNTLEVPATWAGKRVNLEFDGAFQVTELFVNGLRAGEHKGGYTGFTFDITNALKPGSNVEFVPSKTPAASTDARSRSLRVTFIQTPNCQAAELAELEVQATLTGQ